MPSVNSPYSNFVPQLLKQLNESFALYNKNIAKQLAESFAVQTRISEQLASINAVNFSIGVPDVYAALNIDSPAIMRAFQLSNEIASVTQSLATWQPSYTNQIAEMTIGLDMITKRLAADLTAFRFSYETILSSSFSSYFLDTVRDETEMAAFKAAGWPITPSMPDTLRSRVVQLYIEGKAGYASQSIIGYYKRNDHENLRNTVLGWENHDLLAPRMETLSAALNAHCSANYVLSVPAILPEIEGVLNDFVLANNLTARLGRIGQVYSAVLDESLDFDWPTWVITNTLLHILQNSIYSYTSFEEQLRKPINSRKITRHTVLHGVVLQKRYIDSLRLFLVLDALTILVGNHDEEE